MVNGQAALIGRIGAFALHATHDSRETTAKARATFLQRFEAEVDPEGLLPPAERQRRAEYARKAYFARLAFASARKRSRTKTTAGQASTAVVEAPVEVLSRDRDPQLTPA